jgi:hypothetical protein
MNPNCRKTDLSKDDVEFDDDLKAVLCTGCYCMRHPGWIPPSQVEVLGKLKPPESDSIQYDVRLNNNDGLTARVGIGPYQMSFHVSPDQIAKLTGR